jgi:drug/metabolite transporter (DMT)-like permease
MNPPQARTNAAGVTALLIGATGIGLAPILVRLSETGPIATAFYRLLLAQPIVWLLWKRESLGQDSSGPSQAGSPIRNAAIAGLLFAADLSIWHWSLKLTTVANSTFVTNLTPFFVSIAAWFLFRERIARRLAVGMAIAFCGGFFMVAESVRVDRLHLLGDAVAVVSAVFYAGYILAVKQLRRNHSTWYVMAWTGLFAAPVMFLASAATRETLLPQTANGWLVLIALALISQIGGQGMIAYGLAHLSASVSAVLLMWQPVVAALLARWILKEPLTPLRALGGAIIIAGILIGTWRPNSDSATN